MAVSYTKNTQEKINNLKKGKTHETHYINYRVVGCGEVEDGAYKHRPKQTDTNESTPTTNTNEVSGATEKPVKELTAEEKKVVGTYKMEGEGFTIRAVFLENRITGTYRNGENSD